MRRRTVLRTQQPMSARVVKENKKRAHRQTFSRHYRASLFTKACTMIKWWCKIADGVRLLQKRCRRKGRSATTMRTRTRFVIFVCARSTHCSCNNNNGCNAASASRLVSSKSRHMRAVRIVGDRAAQRRRFGGGHAGTRTAVPRRTRRLRAGIVLRTGFALLERLRERSVLHGRARRMHSRAALRLE